MGIFRELERRNVVRVAVAYTIVGWLLIQIFELAASTFEAPAWVMKMIITVIVLGFFPTVLFSWAFEMTPEGIKRERDVVRDESITHLTARKLDYITVAAALCVVGLLLWQMFLAVPGKSATDTGSGANETVRAQQTLSPKLGSHSIAVLPFANRSSNDEDLFFTDGIHDDLLTQLSRIHDLKVTSRTSVMEYRDTTKKLPQIAAELGVAAILEGGVQRAGQRIHLNAQLIDVATDTHLWAETYDREMTIDNLFDIQSEITLHIAAAVKAQLTPEERRSLATAPTQSVAAFEAYLRARTVLNGDYTMEEYETAQPMVEDAIRLDPNFAMAYLLLAEIHGQAAWIGYDDTAERKQAAFEMLDKAEALLGSQAPELLAARGEYFYRFAQNYPAALSAQLKALVSMPGNSLILEQVGLTQRRMGLWEDALESFRQGAELDPANVSLRSLTADTLLAMRQWSRLDGMLKPARARFAYDVDLALAEVLLSLWSRGDVVTARQQYNAIRPNPGEFYFQVATELPWFEHDIAEVIRVWNQPEVLKAAANVGWAGVRELALAMAHLQLHEIDRADELLSQVIQDLTGLDRSRRNSAVAADLGTLAIALALKGENARAVQLAEEAIQIFSKGSDSLDGLLPLQRLCSVLALTGERDRALDLLADLIDVPGGFVRWELYLDPRWDFFRDDERFNNLIRPRDLER